MATRRTIPQYLVFDSQLAIPKHEQKTLTKVGVRFGGNKKTYRNNCTQKARYALEITYRA